MRLGVTYSVFNGEEMLRGSILSIRKHVDYINAVYQEYSWTGNKASDSLLAVLNKLKEERLIDTIIKYPFNDFNNKKKMSYYICKKKNLGLKDLKKNRCTYCMIMDADEFYKEEEFIAAKNFVEEHHITHTCCSIYDYKIKPIYRMEQANNYAVPFIFKLRWYSLINSRPNLPCFIDPLRAIPMFPFMDKFYYLNSVNMHHMTGIRGNIETKLLNTVSNMTDNGRIHIQTYRKKHNELAEMDEEQLLERGYIKVKNYFGLGICDE